MNCSQKSNHRYGDISYTYSGTGANIAGTLDAPNVLLYNATGSLTLGMNNVRPTAAFSACVDLAIAGCSTSNTSGGTVTINNSRTVSGAISINGTSGVTINGALSGGSFSGFNYNSGASTLAVNNTLTATAGAISLTPNGTLTIANNLTASGAITLTAATAINLQGTHQAGSGFTISNNATLTGANVLRSTGAASTLTFQFSEKSVVWNFDVR